MRGFRAWNEAVAMPVWVASLMPMAVTRHSVRLSGRGTSTVASPLSPVQTAGVQPAVSWKFLRRGIFEEPLSPPSR